jgi:hypothetical protein
MAKSGAPAMQGDLEIKTALCDCHIYSLTLYKQNPNINSDAENLLFLHIHS